MEAAQRYQSIFKNYEMHDRMVVENNFERVNFWSVIHLSLMIVLAVIQVVTIRSLFESKSTVGKFLRGKKWSPTSDRRDDVRWRLLFDEQNSPKKLSVDARVIDNWTSSSSNCLLVCFFRVRYFHKKILKSKIRAWRWQLLFLSLSLSLSLSLLVLFLQVKKWWSFLFLLPSFDFE